MTLNSLLNNFILFNVTNILIKINLFDKIHYFIDEIHFVVKIISI